MADEETDMKHVYELANNLVLAIMKQALVREANGELVIERGANGEHIRYSLTLKGAAIAESRERSEIPNEVC